MPGRSVGGDIYHLVPDREASREACAEGRRRGVSPVFIAGASVGGDGLNITRGVPRQVQQGERSGDVIPDNGRVGMIRSIIVIWKIAALVRQSFSHVLRWIHGNVWIRRSDGRTSIARDVAGTHAAGIP